MNKETAKLIQTFSDLFRKPANPIKAFYLKLSGDQKEKFKEEMRRAIKDATAYKGEKDESKV